MSGKILYRGVATGDSHPLADPSKPKSRPPSTSGDDALDPRIQIELETLNRASHDINCLELQLNEARSKFRLIHAETTQTLNTNGRKLGSCIEKARPYYDARIKAKEAQAATQNAALRYERSCGQLAAAKEMVYLAEEGFFNKGQPFDPAWQEMLNHATIKVNDAEKERYESGLEHQLTAQLYAEAEQLVKRLQKELRRNVIKSKPYFEMKSRLSQQMEEQKHHVEALEHHVTCVKKHYATTLSNLERISDEIHHQRSRPKANTELGERGEGVGAESPRARKLIDSKSQETNDSESQDDGIESNLQTTKVTEEVIEVEVEVDPTKTFYDPLTNTKYSLNESNHKKVPSRQRIDSQNQPGSSQNQPSSSQNQVSSNQNQPGSSQNQPVSSQNQLGSSQNQPGSSQNQPGSSQNQQGSTHVQPTASQSKMQFQHNVSNTQCTPPDVTSQKEDITAKSAPDVQNASQPKSGVERRKVVLSPAREELPGPPRVVMRQRPRGAVAEIRERHVFGGLCDVPKVKVVGPVSAPTSPTNPSDNTVSDNAQLMADIQRQKSRPVVLRSNRRDDDLLDTWSDTESLSSMASASMLDDEQISSLMLDMGDYSKFLSQMDEKQSKNWKRLSLPAKLTEVEKTFNLDELLADARMIEEENLYGENLAPRAYEEDLGEDIEEVNGNIEDEEDIPDSKL